MKFTLRQLAVFVHAAQHENISRAASALAMSQSAASGALKELEDQFNTRLFDRIGKRLRLNAQGQALMPQAQHILAQADEFERHLIQSEIPSPLNVGATHTIGNYLAVKVLAAYLEKFPQAKVDIHIANTQTIKKGVMDFELDIGLVEGEVNEASLKVVPWQSDELVLFCSPRDPLAKAGALSDEDLIKAKWILREQGSGTRQAFERSCAGVFSEFNILLELDHTQAIKQAVIEGLGIACLSKTLLETEIALGKVVPLIAKDRDFNRRFYIIHRKDKFMSSSLSAWLSLCSAHCVSSVS